MINSRMFCFRSPLCTVSLQCVLSCVPFCCILALGSQYLFCYCMFSYEHLQLPAWVTCLVWLWICHETIKAHCCHIVCSVYGTGVEIIVHFSCSCVGTQSLFLVELSN